MTLTLLINSLVGTPPDPFIMGNTTYAPEIEQSVPGPDWTSDLVVFEHIGLRSGGDINDPSGCSPQFHQT